MEKITIIMDDFHAPPSIKSRLNRQKDILLHVSIFLLLHHSKLR